MRNSSSKPSRVKNTKAVTPSIKNDVKVDTYVEQDEINESPGRKQEPVDAAATNLTFQKRKPSAKGRPPKKEKTEMSTPINFSQLEDSAAENKSSEMPSEKTSMEQIGDWSVEKTTSLVALSNNAFFDPIAVTSEIERIKARLKVIGIKVIVKAGCQHTRKLLLDCANDRIQEVFKIVCEECLASRREFGAAGNKYPKMPVRTSYAGSIGNWRVEDTGSLMILRNKAFVDPISLSFEIKRIEARLELVYIMVLIKAGFGLREKQSKRQRTRTMVLECAEDQFNEVFEIINEEYTASTGELPHCKD